MELVFATNNAHKLAEVREILAGDFDVLGLHDIGCHEDIDETADTFEGNAFLKAIFIFENYHKACLSDDSGLEVEALDYAPGVFSARYAGEHGNHTKNMDKLLLEMTGIENRNARFRTVLCYIDQQGNPNYFEGIIRGTITKETRGEGGFGYDPVFIPDGYTQTFAEMPAEEKNKISHRALALKAFRNYLRR